MLRASFISAVALVASLAAPATAQDEAQIAEALGNFTRAQQALGANEACFVLEEDARVYAQILAVDMQRPLKRAIGDTFDPDSIREDAREAFEGCKSRAAAPQIWEAIDATRDLGAIMTVGASLMALAPSDCTQRTHALATAEQLDNVAALTLSELGNESRRLVNEIAPQVVPIIESDCAKKPIFSYPSALRPAIARLKAYQHLNHLQGEVASSQLASVGALQPGDTDPWIGAVRSSLTISRPLGSDYTVVTGARTFDEQKAAASAALRSGSTFKGNGHLYFTRDRLIAARIDGDYDAVVLATVEGNRAYTLGRTNKGVKPDFFGENQAEFEMFESERDKFFTENDENTDFYILYRPTTKGSLRPFVVGSTDRRSKVNMGDLVRGYLWAMAPSAIDQ